MRSFSSGPGFFAAGALAFGCAVYDSELVTTDGLSGNGADSSGGSATAGTSSDSAGKSSTTTAGTFTSHAGEGATGGSEVTPVDGGAGGEGGDASSGTAAGGKAGASMGGTGGSSNGGKAGAGGGSTAGSGGGGGTTSVVKCADHALPLKTTWIATASSSSVGNGTEADGLYNPPAHMLDSSYTERWSSGHAQAGDEWIQIDLGAVSTITDLTLNPGNDAGDYPRSYAVRVSNKNEDFAAAVKASGTGMPGTTFVHFGTPAVGRYITVRQTGAEAGNPWWTIAEVLVGCTDP